MSRRRISLGRPSHLALAPVLMITASAWISVFSSTHTLCTGPLKSTLVTQPLRTSVSKRMACAFRSSIISGPLRPLRVAGVVVHLRGLCELSAGQGAFDHHRLQVGARCIDGGGISCRTRSDDQAFDVFGRGAHGMGPRRYWRGGFGVRGSEFEVPAVSRANFEPRTTMRPRFKESSHTSVSMYGAHPAQMPSPPVMLVRTLAGVLNRSPCAGHVVVVGDVEVGFLLAHAHELHDHAVAAQEEAARVSSSLLSVNGDARGTAKKSKLRPLMYLSLKVEPSGAMKRVSGTASGSVE